MFKCYKVHVTEVLWVFFNYFNLCSVLTCLSLPRLSRGFNFTFFSWWQFCFDFWLSVANCQVYFYSENKLILQLVLFTCCKGDYYNCYGIDAKITRNENDPFFPAWYGITFPSLPFCICSSSTTDLKKEWENIEKTAKWVLCTYAFLWKKCLQTTVLHVSLCAMWQIPSSRTVDFEITDCDKYWSKPFYTEKILAFWTIKKEKAWKTLARGKC